MHFNDPNHRRVDVIADASGATTCPSGSSNLDVGVSGLAGVNVAMTVGYNVSGTLTPTPGKSLPSGMWAYLRPQSGSCMSTVGVSVGADGTYSTPAVLAGSYVVYFEIDNVSCTVSWISSALMESECVAPGTPITITSSSISGLNGQLPSDWP
jgi:hypothetical protein